MPTLALPPNPDRMAKAGGAMQKQLRRRAATPQTRWQLRRVLGTLSLVLALTWGLVQWSRDNPIGYGHYLAKFADWDLRRDQVREAFVTSWDAYSQHAWGKSSRRLPIFNTSEAPNITPGARQGCVPPRLAERLADEPTRPWMDYRGQS